MKIYSKATKDGEPIVMYEPESVEEERKLDSLDWGDPMDEYDLAEIQEEMDELTAELKKSKK